MMDVPIVAYAKHELKLNPHSKLLRNFLRKRGSENAKNLKRRKQGERQEGNG
jgi:hypothetical protein